MDLGETVRCGAPVTSGEVGKSNPTDHRGGGSSASILALSTVMG
jgi:hypothetical protein